MIDLANANGLASYALEPRIREVMGEIAAASSEESASAAEERSGQARQLSALIGRFALSGQRGREGDQAVSVPGRDEVPGRDDAPASRPE